MTTRIRLALCGVRIWDAWIEGKPQWEVVLEVDALDLNNLDDDGTRWALADFQLIYPTADRALVFLSPGSSDARIMREFDVEAREFVANGFELPAPGHHSVAWIDRNTVYVSWDDSAANVAPALTHAGYPRQVRRWGRGTPIADAPVVFECKPDDLSATASYDQIHARHTAFRSTKFYEMEQFWLDEEVGEWRLYDVPRDAGLFEWNGWLFVTPRTGWNVNATIYRGGSLLAVRRDGFLDGDRHCTVLFEPTERNVLSSVGYTKHWLTVSHKNESASTCVTLWRPPASDGGMWEAQAFPLPTGCEASVTAVDSARDDAVLVYVDHFLTQPALYLAEFASDVPWRLLGQLLARFDATGFVAQRRHATAADGVQIPYWLIGREADLQGSPRPCLLYGYGGFEVSVDTPAYMDSMGFSWLEPGGVYAIASIRGGGEFGPEWHRAAQREKRQVAFDDFIAVAEAIWIDEYGDPDNQDDHRMLMAYSPYHNVNAVASYPAVLFTSSSTDDRVHPGHARKMVAKMQALGHDEVWYLEHRDGGHGAGVEP
ncbi:prolyl oligopeptidase family serine peptidase [Burkholderia ubonensis]|uniref:prolyl oligopeptidase family serine peptidase n=1 Tax=Burkholderia ubonensis TaxID=101571 RepID=UPI001E5D489D|nr:prolyl oligopeptidase family serine peptidase [Burkholderia ubonensis]